MKKYFVYTPDSDEHFTIKATKAAYHKDGELIAFSDDNDNIVACFVLTNIIGWEVRDA